MQEPDDARATSPSILAEELSDREGSTVQLVVDVREYAVSEPDSHHAAEADTLDLEDYDVPAGEAMAAGEGAVEVRAHHLPSLDELIGCLVY